MKRIIVLFLLTCTVASVCYARIEGVEYTTITVNKVQYDVPLANKEYREKIYYLKKALKGDEDARDMLLEGKEQNFIFIGSESPLWLKITKTDFEVKEEFQQF